MSNIFTPHRSQTAEAALHRSFEQSVHQLAQLTYRLMTWQPISKKDDEFPEPDLAEMAGAPDDPPDSVRAQLQTRTVAATAAVLTEAYGEGGQYQAEGYSIQSSPCRGGTTAYQVTALDSQRAVFAFEQDHQGQLSIQDDQLSEQQTQDFLRVAQRITQDGFEPMEADNTGRVQAEVLGALAPANSTDRKPNRVKTSAAVGAEVRFQRKLAQQSPTTALDLVQWRYASVVLGRHPQQVQHITQLAQAAGQAAGQSFLQLYRKDRNQPLLLQPQAQDLPQMQRDIQQLKDLVWQVGPQRVEQLYQTQQRLASPISIARNEQVSDQQER